MFLDQLAQIFYRYTEGVTVEQRENMAKECTPWVVLLRGTTSFQGVKVVLEAKAVELPLKGVCDRVGVFFGMARLSAGMVAEAAVESHHSWRKLTSVGRNQSEYGNGGCCRFLLQRRASKTPRSPGWQQENHLFQKGHWTKSRTTPYVTRVLEWTLRRVATRMTHVTNYGVYPGENPMDCRGYSWCTNCALQI